MSRNVEKVPGGSPRFLIRTKPFCSTTKSRPVSPGGEATKSGRPVSPVTTGTPVRLVFEAGVTPVQSNAAAGSSAGRVRTRRTAATRIEVIVSLLPGIPAQASSGRLPAHLLMYGRMAPPSTSFSQGSGRLQVGAIEEGCLEDLLEKVDRGRIAGGESPAEILE